MPQERQGGIRAINLSGIRNQQTLFSQISFELHRGELLFVEGANGSGKSTLLRMLCGLLTPSQGEILWQGQPVTEIREDFWMNMHYLAHANGIKLGLTVQENLMFARALFQETFLSHDSCDDPLLESLQLSSSKNTQARYLSAGQKRRLALANVFLCNKPLWILDEPLTSLDAMMQQLFFAHLHTHLKTGGLAILTSHHPFDVPETRIHRVRLEC